MSATQIISFFCHCYQVLDEVFIFIWHGGYINHIKLWESGKRTNCKRSNKSFIMKHFSMKLSKKLDWWMIIMHYGIVYWSIRHRLRVLKKTLWTVYLYVAVTKNFWFFYAIKSFWNHFLIADRNPSRTIHTRLPRILTKFILFLLYRLVSDSVSDLIWMF